MRKIEDIKFFIQISNQQKRFHRNSCDSCNRSGSGNLLLLDNQLGLVDNFDDTADNFDHPYDSDNPDNLDNSYDSDNLDNSYDSDNLDRASWTCSSE